MCLATVYKRFQEDESVVLKNVSKIQVEGNQIHLFDIMGMEEVVEGTISMADLTGGVVKITCPA
ncbi:MAG: CooT family nickel-binding protein [Lachnospiraceae bacterium]|nr:CooT family nickel-binding protein [Lachnospiraceae bacterium]